MNLRSFTALALAAVITLPAAVAHADALAVSCAGVPTTTNITWTATPTGGVAPYTYLWTSGATSAAQTITVTPGTYSQTITATDASSTAASASCSASVLPAKPTISTFAATPSTITVGGSSALSWTVANASSTAIDHGIGNVSSTSLVVNPAVTTTYILSATNPGGTSTSSVTVTVNPVVQNAPTISSFTASPSSITAGGSTVLSWNVSNASSTSINNGVGTVSSTSVTVNPAITTTYTMTATNPSGTTTANVTVTVTPVSGGTGLTTQIQALLAQIKALQAQIAALVLGQIGGGTGTGTTTPPVIPPGVCNPIGRDINRGAYGDDVKDLQKFLAKHPNLYPEGIVNGFYGPHTQQAVKRWQKLNGLPMTGFFGSLSRNFWKKQCVGTATSSASSIIPTIGSNSNSTISLDDIIKAAGKDNSGKNKNNGRNDREDRDDRDN